VCFNIVSVRKVTASQTPTLNFIDIFHSVHCESLVRTWPTNWYK